MIQYLYLGRVSYDEGLRLQAEMASLVVAGRLGNVLLLLEHPAVLTLGRNADRTNVLGSDELLEARGVVVRETNRGGDVTYHGPGQLVGYPIFDLRSLKNRSGSRMGAVDFVRGMEEALIQVCATFGIEAGQVCGLTGVWCGIDGPGAERKVAAIGIHVSRGITSHGFALNVTTNLSDFELIVPCGIRDHAVTSLEQELGGLASVPSLEQVAHETARVFGGIFREQVTGFESLEALRVAAGESARAFPAEDTPLRVPADVERLRGVPDAAVRA